MADFQIQPVSADGKREWRTEGETRQICREEMSEIMEKLVDGAQAAMNTATILHGNPSLGIKGALPDIQDRLQHLEEARVADQVISAANHASNTKRLQTLEDNQGWMRTAMSNGFAWISKFAGQLDTIWKVAFAATGGVAVHACWETIMKWIRHLVGGR